MLERGSDLWFRLRHSRLVDNIVALYVVHFANYLLPLITVPYTVRVLTPSGYGLAAFALSFAGFFGIIADYAFGYTATRAIAVHRDSRQEVSRIVSQVMFTKAVLLANCAWVFWLLKALVAKLHGNNLVMWMAFLYIAALTLTPGWLYQGLEELRFSSRVSLVPRVAYVPALFLFVRHPADVWKWMVLQTAVASVAAGTLWLHAWLRLGVSWVRPRWADLETQMREGFSLFVSQAATTAYITGNTFILGMFTNVTVAGYFAAADRIMRVVFGLLGPVTQAVYPRASQLAASSREAALQLTRKTLFLMGAVGLGMSACLFVGAPWLVPVVLGPRFLPSVTIMQILSPVPFLVALSTVLGGQVMVPFKHDTPFTLILVSAGMFNLVMASLLAQHWQGNGMALSVTCSEVLVAAGMFLYLSRRGLMPALRRRPEAAGA